MNRELDIYHQLGKRIRYLREKKKMSSLDFSLEAGINKNYLLDLENGKRNPSLMVLRRISIALQIDISELLVGVRDYILPGEENKIK